MSSPEGDLFFPLKYFYALEKFGDSLMRGDFFQGVGKIDFSVMRTEARGH